MGRVNVVYVPVAEIKEYANNPRNNDDAVDYVENSIREFGFRVPLVITEDREIVTGHTRLKAAKRIGLEEVPCVIADDLTDEQAAAFRLADNKTQELSSWEYRSLMSELEELGDFSMDRFGFLNLGEEEKEETETPKQTIGGTVEIDLSSFSDDAFRCTCPECGFKFND